ncbi:hypothetical protein A2U01_0064127, partial [Trifolium medium]|nr:hypothetical protein [Trifolium medium]
REDQRLRDIDRVRDDDPTHDDDPPALIEDADDKMIETCGIVVGMTADCPT